MKIALFSTKDYDRQYFDTALANYKHKINYFEAAFRTTTTNLITDEKGVCVFVNDKVDAPAIARLADKGVELIALRCAGFNNVDLVAAK